MSFLRAFLTLAGIVAILAACGTRGPLTLPPPPSQQPKEPAKAEAVDHSSKAKEADR